MAAHASVSGHDLSAHHSPLHPTPPPSPPPTMCPADLDDVTSSPSSCLTPVTASAQPSREGVLSALQSLQEKMQRLEVERRAAESSLHSLASQTHMYKTSLHRPLLPHHPHTTLGEEDEEEEEEKEEEEETGGSVSPTQCNGHPSPHTQQLDCQLSSAEDRCLLLEKQLTFMRQLVKATGRQPPPPPPPPQQQHQQQQQHHHHVYQKQRHQVYGSGQDSVGYSAEDGHQWKTQDGHSPFPADHLYYGERVGELERDHVRLTASHTLAEQARESSSSSSSIRQPPQQVLTPHHPTADIPPPPPPPPPPSSGGPKKKRGSSSSGSTKKKKKKVAPATGSKAMADRTARGEQAKHYRLNLADIPFVAGKSTAPSHAVGANVQKVLAIMKSHNMALCSASHNNGHAHSNGHAHNVNSHAHSTNGHAHSKGQRVGGRPQRSSPHPSPSSSSTSLPVDLDLGDLLVQLQDEFGQLSLEQQEYLGALQQTTDPALLHDLHSELDALLVCMEVKGQQIAKVKQHQQRLEDARRASVKRGGRSRKGEVVSRPTSAQGRLQQTTPSTNPRHPHPHTSPRHPRIHSSGNLRPTSSASLRCGEGSGAQNHPEVTTPSLSVLRDMRKLQTTLRRDDLCWE